MDTGGGAKSVNTPKIVTKYVSVTVRVLGALGDANKVVVPEQIGGVHVIVKLDVPLGPFVPEGEMTLVVRLAAWLAEGLHLLLLVTVLADG